MIGKKPNTLGLLLHDTARLLRRLIDRQVAPYQITRAKWLVLGILDRENGVAQNVLAERLELDKSTVTRLIDRMERRGLVERRPDAHDRRISRIYLHSGVGPLLADLERISDQVRHTATRNFTAAERRTLEHLLAKLKTNLLSELDRPDHAPHS